MLSGIIIKGIGSFYYILDDESKEIFQCKLRGLFRNADITPMIGDRVRFVPGENNSDGIVEEILPRESCLTRPAIANATQSVIVSALKQPDISTVLLDKMLINNEISGLRSIICFNKADLADETFIDSVMNIYRRSGAVLIPTSTKTERGLNDLLHILHDHITVFCGVSGAGKSTLLNGFLSDREIETGDISKKLKRGKHTTRHSELIVLDNGAYIFDTPGFSDLSLDIDANELWKYYNEFYEYSNCKYNSCLHLKEPGCSVKKAVDEGNINSVRYENYKIIYEQLKRVEKKY